VLSLLTFQDNHVAVGSQIWQILCDSLLTHHGAMVAVPQPADSSLSSTFQIILLIGIYVLFVCLFVL
jgi:hypothetical protein